MSQACQNASLREEARHVLIPERDPKYLKRRIAIEITMLPQVDICEGPAAQVTNKTIVAKLLADAILHAHSPTKITVASKAPKL
jgi:hypothetical protein